MPFDWWEYLSLAEELSKSPKDEARARSAISRAYYACYHQARRRLLEKNLNRMIPGYGVHEAVWQVYKEHSDRTCKKIGTDGDRLRVLRTISDYRPTISNLPNELTAAMIKAREVKNDISALPASLP